MATLKHINSKNADYGAAEQYLLFEHDEFTMKPVLDETGRLIPREDYRLSTLNCGGEDFAVACMRANLRYEKNQRREDVKSHHYIISFDPRDGPDNGLTVDRAQELGEKFCAEHFPGHQALVCTHPDGHNHSGNIHVHIVINSLRIEEVPFLPYMDRPADTVPVFFIHTAPGCPFSLHGQNNCPPVMGKCALRLRPVGTGAWPSRSLRKRRARHRAGGLTAAA